jgi:adenine deaminase
MKISGRVVDLHRRMIYGAVISIEGGLIQSITECAEVPDLYIIPGFIDAHVHIESSMVTPGAFAQTAISHGTVQVVSDPHEIANVMGLEGVRFMLDDSGQVPMRFSFGAPSCVPATPFESSGAVLGVKEVEELLSDPGIGFLSEMMNYPGVIGGDDDIVAKIGAAKRFGKPVDGHAPGITGERLRIYADAGISTDHECTSMEEAREKVAMGMKILIREGSAAKNLEALHPLISEVPDMVMLCCDDIHPDDLIAGHINVLVNRLLDLKYDVFDVLRSASVNAVNHYGLATGLLRTGDSADFLVTDSLEQINVLETYIKGVKLYDRGAVLFRYPGSSIINNFNSSMISPGQISLRLTGRDVRVIEVYDGQLFTGNRIFTVPADSMDGYNPGSDVLKIVVKERYNDKPPVAALVKGFGLKKGAFASSVAHDSHNIIAVGTDDESVCRAVNMVVEMKGGLAWAGPEEDLSMQLNIAGIISSSSVESISTRYQELTDKVRDAGCVLKAPFMTLSFMALLVIPELKVGDRGLFDVNKFEFVHLCV